jgi:uncharacterized membrane protein YsdA (DUF1294 family)
MQPSASGHLAPWLSIWTRPRATIRAILDSVPDEGIGLLATVSGISGALDRAAWRNLGDKFSLTTILLIAIFGGPIGNILGIYVRTDLFWWTGKWIGGKADASEIRAAVTWSYLPLCASLILWIPQLVIFGTESFTTESPRLDESIGLEVAFVGFTAAKLALLGWSFVILFNCLGEVQGFSTWRAVGNYLLALLLVAVPVGAIVAFVYFRRH